MKTNQEILKGIQAAITLNKNAKAVSNTALTDAMSLIMHNEKELQKRLDTEYKRGMNDAWEIARELCKVGYDECTEIFGDSSVETAIKNYTPKDVKEKIASFREEKEKKEEIIIGNIVIDRDRGIKATVLEFDKSDNTFCVFTQNGDIEYWFRGDIENTGEFVDINNVLFK